MIRQAMDWLDALPMATVVMLFGFGWLLVACALGAVISAFWPTLRREDDPCQNGTCETCFPETDPWPWCDGCNSWHHPDNPTCKRRD